ncbi:SDR family NAD(P)-dependent oxidoreductase [Thermoflavimicrobium dichotomicum]|uniref:NAD(P)-dependent dehydrogenase, short-chain alcohol dehydrogenase family n=1 Tax=Thermoflavimicrobium dichotomicum TaxID=46223 RepID=A0A1I3T8W6_9BACL|nr:SDR family NAD(P)-dependent oxidoreductase [Thermoflavimicrobium dichotomicum]SFJ67040.1 NAD(P)-dependent dehydrogenase, short-chain alcohol dehydrogenase family [Thermoflavimicrobium dichotomicum]
MAFEDQVVLITGAAGGIGKATARKFAESGAKLALVDLNEEALKQVVNELQLSNEQTLAIPADCSDEEQVIRYTRQTVDRFGRIDVFFNNAGIEGKIGAITDLDIEVLDQVYQVNIRGVFLGLKHVLKVMKEQRSGAVINTASVAGKMGTPGLGAYVASKHAVIGLTKTAALECADFGIRVNAICPAPIHTRMMRSIEEGTAPGHGQMIQEQFAQKIPMKRYGEVGEVANLVYFLASDEAKFITGAHYAIDGGMSATSL